MVWVGGLHGALIIVIANALEVVAEAPSVTCTVKLKVPLTVGVPVITPDGDKEVPVGNVPLNKVKVYVGVPPEAKIVWL